MDKKDNERLVQNNLSTQLELYKDITEKYHNIIYHIKQNAVEAKTILVNAHNNDSTDDKVVILMKDYDKLVYDILIYLENDDKFEKLGILAVGAMKDINNDYKLLSTLNK